MRFLVCGAGAIGGVLGGQLAKAGFDVLYIDKTPQHVQAIKQHGLQLRGVHGNHTLHIPIVRQASAIHFRPDDVIIMAVKSFHCTAAAAELRRATTLQLPIFCAQNGVANEGLVARYFRHVHGMMVLIGATRLEPGVVVHTGNGPLGLGAYPVGMSQAAEDVAVAFEATDLPIYTTEHITQHKWYKLLLNLNNATLGLTGWSIPASWAHAAGRLWMADVWEEGARVLTAAGIGYDGPAGLHTIAEHIAALRQASAAPPAPGSVECQGQASLWQDLYHRRGAVEADVLNGEIVRLGRQYHVPTPYNSLMLALINDMAAARELPGKYTVPQLRQRLQD